MMKEKYFYGSKVSDYGIQNGYVDYAALANSFDCVLNNNIMSATADIGYWEPVSGDYSDEAEPDFYQNYIVSDQGAKILQEAGEYVWYNEELDLYVWGVTHYGTAWSYVLTGIKIDW